MPVCHLWHLPQSTCLHYNVQWPHLACYSPSNRTMLFCQLHNYTGENHSVNHSSQVSNQTRKWVIGQFSGWPTPIITAIITLNFVPSYALSNLQCTQHATIGHMDTSTILLHIPLEHQSP